MFFSSLCDFRADFDLCSLKRLVWGFTVPWVRTDHWALWVL
jgi:hypothetical protein